MHGELSEIDSSATKLQELAPFLGDRYRTFRVPINLFEIRVDYLSLR